MYFFCEFCGIFKNTLFTEHLQKNAFDYTFIERKTLALQTKILRINISEIISLIQKKQIFTSFFKYSKNSSNGDFLHSYNKERVI